MTPRLKKLLQAIKKMRDADALATKDGFWDAVGEVYKAADDLEQAMSDRPDSMGSR